MLVAKHLHLHMFMFYIYCETYTNKHCLNFYILTPTTDKTHLKNTKQNNDNHIQS